MTAMDEKTRESFLGDTKIAVLSTNTEEGPPFSVPIWFEWDGSRACFFTGVNSPKMQRMSIDPRVSLLVANPTGAPEQWVLIEGRVKITEGNAFDLAERLAHRYWDMEDPAHIKMVDEWRTSANSLRLLEILPTRIRSSK